MILAVMVVRSASEVNLPSSVHWRMLFNILLDFVVGLVPFIGDLADAAYKCNTRNAVILEDFLRARGAENIRKQGVAPPVDLSLPEEYEQQPELQQSQHVASPPQPPPSHMRGGAHRNDIEAQKSTHSGSRPSEQPTRGSEKGKEKGRGKGKGKGGSSRG